MKKISFLAGIAALLLFGCPKALGNSLLEEIRETPGKAGGVYYAYPIDSALNTPPPAGYKPFYVSHYGRHGSRYLISDRDYKVVLDRLHDAAEHNALTPLGLDVMARLDTVWLEANGRGGELSPLGNRQHRSIGRRMGESFPEAFEDGAEVTASSTTVMRCAHSMFSFIEGLKDIHPSLEIPRESGERNMYFLNYHSPESGRYSGHDGAWYQPWKRFREQQTQPDRLMESLFSDRDYVKTWVDPVEMMWQLYWVTVDMQNMETPITFDDIFTAEELYNLWQVFNFNFFACNSSYAAANGELIGNARNLVNDILVNADSYIADGRHGATLRFGHDGNVIPLTALLRLEGCYTDVTEPADLAEAWTDFKICPMAGNVQFVFFKNDADDVIVKIMLNEREHRVDLDSDIYPFYRWSELRPYLENIVKK